MCISFFKYMLSFICAFLCVFLLSICADNVTNLFWFVFSLLCTLGAFLAYPALEDDFKISVGLMSPPPESK